MGPLLFPVFAFILWEFPSMVLMALHKATCALTGTSFQDQYAGVWPYRLAGLFLWWPAILVTGGLAAGAGFSAGVGRFLLGVEAVSTIALLIWARVSHRGA